MKVQHNVIHLKTSGFTELAPGYPNSCPKALSLCPERDQSILFACHIAWLLCVGLSVHSWGGAALGAAQGWLE